MAEKVTKHIFTVDERKRGFFFSTTVNNSCVRLICGVMATPHNGKRHFRTCHTSYHAHYLPGSTLRAEKLSELKAALCKQQFFFHEAKEKQPISKPIRATHFLIKKEESIFSDGEVFKEAMTIIAKTVLRDEKYGSGVELLTLLALKTTTRGVE